MIPPLTELVAQIPVETIFSQSLEIAADIGLPETAWQPISIGREIIYINAQIASNFSVVMQTGAVAGGFLTYATAAWLTLCAFEIFDTERIESSSATGKITLNNASLVPYTFGPGDVRVLNETNQKTFTCTSGGTVPASGTLTTTEFIADEPGTASNLTVGDVLSLVSTAPGVTPAWQEDLIGQDEETDPALKIRAREANAKASPNGPADAYDYFAKTTKRANGSNVGVTRTNRVEGNGTITVYCADADGALITSDRDLVFANINENVVPTGFTVIVPDPSCVEKNITVQIELVPNPDSAEPHVQTENRIQVAIVEYFATIPVGGDKAQSFQGIYTDTLIQLIRNAAGVSVLSARLILPAANVALANAEIPVLASLVVSWTT